MSYIGNGGGYLLWLGVAVSIPTCSIIFEVCGSLPSVAIIFYFLFFLFIFVLFWVLGYYSPLTACISVAYHFKRYIQTTLAY